MAETPLIDTHSHIFDTAFEPDRPQVVKRALEAGVCLQLMPNIDLSTVPALLSTAEQHPCCLPMLGLHPTSVGQNFEHELDALEHIIPQHKFYGIGEIGIDLYWDTSLKALQEEAFRIQLRWAKRTGLPVSIHVRSSFNEVLRVIDSEHDSRLAGVFHCFGGTVEQYHHIADYGTFMVGLGGVATYKNGGFDKIAPIIDPTVMLLETDAPYLAPTPMRGKRNEPAYLEYTAAHLAKALHIAPAELKRITTQNAIRLFGLPPTTLHNA